ncbi:MULTISPECIES: acyl carrier protein [Lactococcus]|uniref:Acyl carrier protein n=2 Tax=Lactococcus TaxID=1357 RepID=A0A387BN53_9LACT|nr:MULTISPECIES: acyl carrier protein [Lactococcus]AYF99950.1 acyl carrier protein [Lactococcus allomyrinae]MCL2112597.1 acyl carrier protein [Streptococcaceae bacterium]QDK70906.1 acyl carrier protein [Lactococcus protaetiae]
MAVFEKVQDIIADELGKDKEEVTLETSFEELDADSLDLFQIINDIEDEFDVEVDTEADMKTVADLVKYVEDNK